jgi:hypothetical protein
VVRVDFGREADPPAPKFPGANGLRPVKKDVASISVLPHWLTQAKKTNRSNGVRLPASDLESRVIDRLRAFLGDPAALLEILADELHCSLARTDLIERSRSSGEELRAQAPTAVKNDAHELALPRDHRA